MRFERLVRPMLFGDRAPVSTTDRGGEAILHLDNQLLVHGQFGAEHAHIWAVERDGNRGVIGQRSVMSSDVVYSAFEESHKSTSPNSIFDYEHGGTLFGIVSPK
jgi:hypothetical protein